MISIVVPVCNEEESLPHLYGRLKNSIPQRHEIIFIDDGSTDRSLEILKDLAKKDPALRIFSFRRNQGKAEALTLGFQKAKGERIVTLDADLQDRPEEIENLLRKMDEGIDVVSGWKKERHDAVHMKMISKVFNYLTGIMWGIRLHDYNCGLKAYTKEAAKSLHLYGGMHRFIPILLAQQGFSLTEIPVMHDERKYGKSKYGFSKILNIPDMFTLLFLTRYSKRPLHFFATAGGMLFVIGFVIFMYLWIGLHIIQHLSIGTRPLFFVSLIMMLAGLQVFFTGFLADLIIDIAHSPKTEQDGSHHVLRYNSDEA